MKRNIKVTWVAKCGKLYETKEKCLLHENVCKCWTNPDFKTCVTCKFSKVFKEYGDDDFITDINYYRECQNPKMKESMFVSAHEKAQDVCINCPKWQKDTRKLKRKATVKPRSPITC